MKSQNSYLKFLLQAEAVNASFDWFCEIDRTTMLLLESIAIRHTNQNPLTITQAMGLISVGSTATIHRKLSLLHELKLVDFVFLGRNRRTKYVHLTSKAEAYFSALGKCLVEVA